MSKTALALLLLASAAVYDPPRVLAWLGPQAQTFGWKLKSMYGLDRIPQFPQVARR